MASSGGTRGEGIGSPWTGHRDRRDRDGAPSGGLGRLHRAVVGSPTEWKGRATRESLSCPGVRLGRPETGMERWPDLLRQPGRASPGPGGRGQQPLLSSVGPKEQTGSLSSAGGGVAGSWVTPPHRAAPGAEALEPAHLGVHRVAECGRHGLSPRVALTLGNTASASGRTPRHDPVRVEFIGPKGECWLWEGPGSLGGGARGSLQVGAPPRQRPTGWSWGLPHRRHQVCGANEGGETGGWGQILKGPDDRLTV